MFFRQISSKHRCIAALETLRSSSFIYRVKFITETCPLKIKGLPRILGYKIGSKNKVSKATVTSVSIILNFIVSNTLSRDKAETIGQAF